MTAGVLVARMMEGMQFSSADHGFSPRNDPQMGGFRVTGDYCADDLCWERDIQASRR